ncbi:hypothetical protein P3T43_001441 [Paraburkholderia sp. GAS41]|uniref:hypothetical protein n=1 Tax=Paraburkholderia sp. GAS41 TaxID=3035134 RepID=UPI003D2395F6
MAGSRTTRQWRFRRPSPATASRQARLRSSRDLAEGRLVNPFEQHAPVQAFKAWLLEEAGSG